MHKDPYMTQQALYPLLRYRFHQVTMGVNVTGMMHCMRAELRVMSPGGSIVNAASAAGLQGVANAGPLSASKHAIIGLTRSVAKEVGKDGTRINCVAP